MAAKKSFMGKRWFLAALGGVLLVARPLAAGELSFRQDIYPVLAARCVKCHGPEEKSGNVDFSSLSDDRMAARQRRLWRKALARVETGEMPPADEPPLNADERTQLIEWMTAAIEHIDCGDPANRSGGPAPARRLSLVEFNRTVHDLMGFEFNAAAVAGIDDEASEANTFGNMAAALEIPPALMDKYFLAADAILDRLFGTELSSNVDGRIHEDARISRETMFGVKPGQWRDPAMKVSPPDGVPPRDAAQAIVHGFMRRAYRGQATDDDLARLMRLYDHATAKGLDYVAAVRLTLKAVLVSPTFLFRIESDRPERQLGESYAVSDRELAVRLSYFLWSSMPDDELLDLAERGVLSAAGPSREPVRYSGTVIGAPGSETHQGNNRGNAFDGDRQTFMDGPNGDSFWIGLDFGEPRPVSRVRYAGRPGWEGRMVGGRFQASNNADFAADVVELFEVSQPPQGYVTHDLDSPANYRYFRYLPLKNSWGNVAEIEFRGLAPGTVLEQQVERMLADARARALTDNFAVRWLQLDKLAYARPSVEFFPAFNGNLRNAAYEEAAAFLDSIRRENRSVLELLDADFTFVNEDLAKYYGIEGVQGRDLQRVKLKPEQHRGGLLGMASVLALTSHTSRTSPTLRGKWILQVVLGTPPPPPPANVSQIDEKQDKKETLTFREKLTEHARNAVCAACHHKMDPLGFALDNFNAVGQWRETIGDRPIDVSGELPTGEKLNGVADLKQVLLARKDQFVRNLTEQLLVFALGRELDYYDDCAVREIADQAKAGGYRYAEFIKGVVNSYAFRTRINQ